MLYCGSWGSVELEPEVEEWLESLSSRDFGHAAFYIDLLERQGVLLSEPYTRQIGGKLRELRFHLERRQVRISYFVASERRIVLLTVFHKRRTKEQAEIRRAHAAMQRCVAQGHTAED
jgi:phage-related protein